MRLDSVSTFPSGMKEYLEYYGWHFSKNMEEWAASKMYKVQNGKKQSIEPYTKADVQAIFDKAKIKISGGISYDVVYVANMCQADFLGSSIQDEIQLAKFVNDYCSDPDAYEGIVFTRFYADCIGSGCGIDWKDMI